MDLLIVIPARGGSKGLAGKNLRTVAGRSLVARAVDVGRAWSEAAEAVDVRIIVDTDDASIAAEAEAAGAWVPFLREPEFAGDTTSTADSVCRLLERLADLAMRPRHLMLLQPTSPLRIAADLTACWDACLRTGHSACTTVALDHPWEQIVRPTPDGRLAWVGGQAPTVMRRQDSREAFFMNGAVYCIRTELLQQTKQFVHAGCTELVPMPRLRSLDIDSAEDLRLADLLAGLREANSNDEA